MRTIKFAFIRDSNYNTIPSRKNPTDAGIDIWPDGDWNVKSGEVKVIPTNLLVEIPSGYFGWLTNRGSSDYLIGAGIIDDTYQGELLVKIANVSGKDIHFSWEDRAFVQLLIIPCLTPAINMVDKENIHIAETTRGASGGIMSQLSTYSLSTEEAYWKELEEANFEELAEDMDLDEDTYDYTADDQAFDAWRESRWTKS